MEPWPWHRCRPAISASAAEDIKKLDDLGDGEDWAVAGGNRSVFRKPDVRTIVSPRLAEIEVCGVGVSCKDHVTIAEEDVVVGVSGDVIQELK